MLSSRRELMRRLGLATAASVLLPLVETVVARPAAANGSPVGGGEGGENGKEAREDVKESNED
jgi:hypothetical protein